MHTISYVSICVILIKLHLNSIYSKQFAKSSVYNPFSRVYYVDNPRPIMLLCLPVIVYFSRRIDFISEKWPNLIILVQQTRLIIANRIMNLIAQRILCYYRFCLNSAWKIATIHMVFQRWKIDESFSQTATLPFAIFQQF